VLAGHRNGLVKADGCHFPLQAAKASLRTILDPKVFPTGFTIQEKLVAVTFARTGCFSKAYAKTTWSFPDVTSDGKRQELLYWDEHAYGSVYDSHSYTKAIERKREEAEKQSEVDAFFSSLESTNPKLKPEDEVVQAPPAFNLGLSGPLYAPWLFYYSCLHDDLPELVLMSDLMAFSAHKTKVSALVLPRLLLG